VNEIEFDEQEWKGEQLILLKKGKEVDTIYLDSLVKEWMREMEEKGIVKYKEVVE
jgi:hypothetical protein